MPTANAAAFSNSIRSTDAPASPALLAERRSAGSWWDSAELTTVRSASEAENLIGQQRRSLHLNHVVDANHVRAAQNGRRNGGRGRALQKGFRSVLDQRQERLSRRPQHQRKFERRQLGEPRQNL